MFQEIGICSCEYPFAEKTPYTGDKLMERIYNTAVNTLKCCFHEHFEDCPWREQGMYMMDSRPQMLFEYYAFDGFEPQKDALFVFAKSAAEKGALPLTSPATVTPLSIPSFTLMWPVALNDYYIHTKDMDTVQELLYFADEIHDFYFSRYDGAGINVKGDNYWNFYDWEYMLCGDSPEGSYDAPLMIYCVLALESYKDLLELCGKNADKIQNEILVLKEKIQTLFWVEDKRMYKTYSTGELHFCELVQSLAIITGIVDKNEKKQLILKLINKECPVQATLSMLFFKYSALIDDEDGKKAVFDDIALKWGDMLMRGATSFYETEDGGYAFDNAGSMCHGWSALPVYFLKKYFSS